MKNITKKATFLLGIMFLFTFVMIGCGKPDPGKLLSNATKNLEKVNSLAADVSLTMNIGVAQNDLNMNMDLGMDMKMEAIKEPQAFHLNTSLDLGDLGGKNTLEVYAQENKAGTKLTTYTATNGEWLKSETEMEEEPTEELTDLDNFHNDDLILDKELQKVDGKDAFSIHSKITGEELEESGLLDLAGGEELSIDFSKVTADVTLMIYKEEQLPAYVEIELKNESKGSESDVPAFLSSMKCEIVYKDYNQIKKITIPNEALDARQDMTQSDTEDVISAIGSGEADETPIAEDPSKIQKDKNGNYILVDLLGKKEFSLKAPKGLKLDPDLTSPTHYYFTLEETTNTSGRLLSVSYKAYELSDSHSEQEYIDEVKDQKDFVSDSNGTYFNIAGHDVKEVKSKDRNFKYSLLTYSYDKDDSAKDLFCNAWFVTEDGFIVNCSIMENVFGCDYTVTEETITDLINNVIE